VTNLINHYFDTLAGAIRDVEVTDANGKAMAVEDAFDRVRKSSHRVHDAGKKILFIGNGGSAGIASHLAIDFTKNGKLRSLAFNDPSALTALGRPQRIPPPPQLRPGPLLTRPPLPAKSS